MRHTADPPWEISQTLPANCIKYESEPFLHADPHGLTVAGGGGRLADHPRKARKSARLRVRLNSPETVPSQDIVETAHPRLGPPRKEPTLHWLKVENLTAK